jgi:uncharacterized protein (UPF0297 family)
MANIKLPPGEKKVPFTLRITEKVKEEIRKVDNYNKIIEELIKDYLKKMH